MSKVMSKEGCKAKQRRVKQHKVRQFLPLVQQMVKLRKELRRSVLRRRELLRMVKLI
jgi:hypothetical protein